ncbi:MAG: hypothetical protein ACI9VM_000842 [Candidatus Azotimanducaceae bacterium]|jgi:hypothetical protein
MTPFVKNGLIFLGLLLVGSLGYYLYTITSESDSGTALNSSRNLGAARVASAQFVRELEDVKSFDLSGDLFNDDKFTSLVDFTKPVRKYPVGRDNPFAPVQ